MNNPQIDVARRVLAELAGMAEHASLTGGLRGGEKSAARAFNGALETVRAQSAIPDGMFEPLVLDDADYGSLGVQARLLLAILGEGESPDQSEGRRRRRERDRERDSREGHGEDLGAVVALAPFLNAEDLAQMLRERIDDTAEVPDGLLTSLAPFLNSGDLGELVRRRMRPRAPEPPQAPAAPATTPAQAPPAPDFRPVVHAPATLEGLAADLRRPDLTAEERQAIATRLAELAYEQAVQS